MLARAMELLERSARANLPRIELMKDKDNSELLARMSEKPEYVRKPYLDLVLLRFQKYRIASEHQTYYKSVY